MKYNHIKTALFLERPNRFIAYADLDGKKVTCHVKNTGRCKELLLPKTPVLLEFHPDAAENGRKDTHFMTALQITSMKQFMNQLLVADAFEPFLLEEAVIGGASTFTIDGHVNREFYGPAPALPSDVRRRTGECDELFVRIGSKHG